LGMKWNLPAGQEGVMQWTTKIGDCVQDL
jgi:hypothetical protein